MSLIFLFYRKSCAVLETMIFFFPPSDWHSYVDERHSAVNVVHSVPLTKLQWKAKLTRLKGQANGKNRSCHAKKWQLCWLSPLPVSCRKKKTPEKVQVWCQVQGNVKQMRIKWDQMEIVDEEISLVRRWSFFILSKSSLTRRASLPFCCTV